MPQKPHKILWIDDEIEALLPHRRFLKRVAMVSLPLPMVKMELSC